MFSVPEIKTVGQVMDTTYLTIGEDATIKEAVDRMLRFDSGILIVKNGKKASGIVTLRDIKNYNGDKIDYTIPISEIMQRDIITIDSKASLRECRDIMYQNGIGALPVKEGEDIVGLITQKHIRSFYYMDLEEYALTLEYIIGQIREGIYAVNAEGTVILWNRFMEERYNIKSEDIVGNNMNDLLKDTIADKVLRTRMSMSDIYYSFQEREQKNLYGLVHANPVYYRDDFVGVVGSELDVTEATNLSTELVKAQEKIKYLQDEVKNLTKGEFDNILGNSYKIQRAKTIAKQVAKTNSSIFIWGESGTGKEVFARAIHEYSERKGQFVPVNCSAIPNELLEEEFFGHESAGTMGTQGESKPGIFEIAKGGTVFLDEVSDLPLNIQAKLLRVIQEREIKRVNGDDVIKVDVRIISATHKNLEQMLKDESFREDLYYRLNVVEIRIPPLRDRKEDIGILVNTFMEEYCAENNKPYLKLSKEALKALEAYTWKGNIRELKNTIENIVVLSTSNIIDREDLHDYILENVNKKVIESAYPLDLNEAIKQLEIRNITKAMRMAKGNKAKAAKILNIPRTTLYYKMENYGLDSKENENV